MISTSILYYFIKLYKQTVILRRKKKILQTIIFDYYFYVCHFMGVSRAALSNQCDNF